MFSCIALVRLYEFLLTYQELYSYHFSRICLLKISSTINKTKEMGFLFFFINLILSLGKTKFGNELCGRFLFGQPLERFFNRFKGEVFGRVLNSFIMTSFTMDFALGPTKYTEWRWRLENFQNF